MRSQSRFPRLQARIGKQNQSPESSAFWRIAHACGRYLFLRLGRVHHEIESILTNRFKNVVGRKIPHQGILAMITQHFNLYFERKDPSVNMARFYVLSVERDLFGEICLVRRWGRIGAGGQTMVQRCRQERDAIDMFLELARRKRARGYKPLPLNRQSTQ